MFAIYRSRHNPHHYVAIDEDDRGENAAGIRESQNLAYLTRVSEKGDPRIAFDPGEAKSRIARDGFYAFAVTVAIREHAE